MSAQLRHQQRMHRQERHQNIMQRLQPHHLEYLLSCVCDVDNIRNACATATPSHLHQQPQQFWQQLQRDAASSTFSVSCCCSPERFRRAAIQPQQPLCSNSSLFFSSSFSLGFSDRALQQQPQLIILRCFSSKRLRRQQQAASASVAALRVSYVCSSF